MLSDWCFKASLNILNPMYALAQQRSELSLTEDCTFRAAAAEPLLHSTAVRCALQ